MENTSWRMNEEEPLSPIARVLQLPGIDCCIITRVGLKKKINPNIILDSLKENVSKHPRFCSKLANDGVKWTKTEVNVENHVFVPDIDYGEIGENGEQFVEDYVSNLSTFPLDRSRPLWDIHVLNVKTSEAEAIVVIRSHHSLGDGMSLMSILMASTRKTTDPETFPTFPTLKRREITSLGLRETNWLMKFIFTKFNALRLIWNTVVDLLSFLATMLFLKDTQSPLQGYTGMDSKSSPRRFCHRTVSLDDIKLIKETLNMTINDVLLGATHAALFRYINYQYEQGKRNAESRTLEQDSKNLPDRIQLCSLVALNLRSKIGIQPLADMMSKGSKCRWGNYVSSVFLPFSIGLKTDPLVYLSKSKSTMNRKKNSFFAIIIYWLAWLVPKLFGAKVTTTLFKRNVSATTMMVSNIVGPVEEVSFQGHPIAYIALSGYGHSQALVIHFISYETKMIISIAVDPSVISDPHKLLDEMEDSLEAIKVALSEGGLL